MSETGYGLSSDHCINERPEITDWRIMLQRLEEVVQRLEAAKENHDQLRYHAAERRIKVLHGLLSQTAQVLRRTQSAFHSRQLKELREQIEEVLNHTSMSS